LPIDALKAIRRGVSFIGCGEVCQIGVYEAVRDVIGDPKFNAIFGEKTSTRLRIQMVSDENPFQGLLRPIDREFFRVGDLVHFQNVPLYQYKHVNGEAAGYMTICCSESPLLFTTLGLSPGGVAKQDVAEILRSEFNRPPVGLSIVSEEIARQFHHNRIAENALREKRLSHIEFTELGGGAISSLSYEVDAARVDQLAKASFKEACCMYERWFREGSC
jgi:hypothetical protein